MSTGAVSRYKFTMWTEFVSVAKGLETGSGAYPGLAPITNLSWRQEQKLRSVATKSRLGGAKTVASNLPLALSVLAVRASDKILILSNFLSQSVIFYY